MTQYDVRSGNEESMWLKYKGNVMLEWVNTTGTEGLPFRYANRGGIHNALQLYLSSTKWEFNFKKKEMELTFHDTWSGQEDGGGGPKLDTDDPENVWNGITITGYLESDIWRNEQPTTTSPWNTPYSPALSLPQKEMLLLNMVKRSGLRENPENEPSRAVSPLRLYLNWGYTRLNFNHIMTYLQAAPQSYTYDEARIELQEKWMPGYIRTWDFKDGGGATLTQSALLHGDSSINLPGRPPAERVEYYYFNTVMDNLRIRDDAANPNRKRVEISMIVDTSTDEIGGGNSPRWYADGDRAMISSAFQDNFVELEPVDVD